MSIQSEITRISGAKSDIADAIEEKGVTVPSGSMIDDMAELILQIEAAGTYQTKTVSPTESQQTVTADSGYDALSSVTVGAISSTYVGSGVTRKTSETFIPGTTAQTIASDTYLTGTQTIQGDANLIASNIANDTTIFGVTGTLERATAMTAAEILTAVQAGWV